MKSVKSEISQKCLKNINK